MLFRGYLVKRPVLDYTFFMLLAYSIILASLLAQADPDIPGTMPYVFVMQAADGTTVRHYVLVDPDELAKDYKSFLTVYSDEPWLPIDKRRQSIRRDDIVEHYPDIPSSRKRRLSEGWEAHGGIEVDTPDGKKWVFQEDYDFAQRATELAKAAYSTPIRPTESPVFDQSKEEQPISVGFWKQWWLHGAIALATIALSVGAICATMLRGPWKSLRS